MLANILSRVAAAIGSLTSSTLLRGLHRLCRQIVYFSVINRSQLLPPLITMGIYPQGSSPCIS